MRAVIIYLAPVLLQGSSCLPSGVAPSRKHRASRPRPPVYVAFQHARFTRAAGYPTTPWALTPRFHPHPQTRAVIFCGTGCERLRAPRRLTGTLPFAVRTFLPLCEQRAMLPTCKPDPVPVARRVAIIYLAPALLQGSSCLPSGIGRAALSRRYTWHFSMQGLPAPAVTCRRRGLLPHVFNLTPRSPLPDDATRQLFSVALSVNVSRVVHALAFPGS